MQRNVLKHGRAVVVLSLLLGCHTPRMIAARPAEPESYRPEWAAQVAPHLGNIRACLADKLPPAGIVYLTALANDATGVTSVDGLGATEHCAARGGEVVHREVDSKRAQELRTLPVFTLERPTRPPLTVVEEVLDEDRAIGYLYWPSEQPPELDAAPSATAPDFGVITDAASVATRQEGGSHEAP